MKRSTDPQNARELDELVARHVFKVPEPELHGHLMLNKYSRRLSDAIKIRDEVRTWPYFKRQEFINNLDVVISERLRFGTTAKIKNPLMCIEAEDLCRAAVRCLT